MKNKIFLLSVIIVIIFMVTLFADRKITKDKYTVISNYNYYQVQQQSENDIKHLISIIHQKNQEPQNYVNQVIATAVDYFQDRPYVLEGSQGEGDWCPGDIYQRGCVHIQQDLIYRTDSMVCNTFVQNVLALLHANTLEDFNKNILSINYGAAGEPPSSIHFYNRNNFISADFNPVNQANGLLKEVNGEGVFSKYVQKNTTVIDRMAWFKYKADVRPTAETVRVIDDKNGPAMLAKLKNNYPRPFHYFSKETITMNYIPKNSLAKKIHNHRKTSYIANENLINQIPVPSVIEIVRNASRWSTNRKNIVDAIGTANDISHLGFIYHKNFKNNELIYRKIQCRTKMMKKYCDVTPVYCQKNNGCLITMFAHATDVYPKKYYYYKDTKNNYHCAYRKLSPGISFTTCNRVTELPLKDYLTSYQYRKYIFMNNPSILGIHVEKIMDVDLKVKFS